MGLRGCRVVLIPVLCLVVFGGMAGCTIGPDGSALLRHRNRLDGRGLGQLEALPEVSVSARIPQSFDLAKAYVSSLYSHQQWRTPTQRTATGVIHINTVLPLSTKVVANIAMNEYSKRAKNRQGRLIARWADSLDRQWFEGEDKTYHVRGFVMTRGNDAWLVYTGWRHTETLELPAIELAERSLQSVLPLSVAPAEKVAHVRLAGAPATRPIAASTTQPAKSAASANATPSFLRTMSTVVNAMRGR